MKHERRSIVSLASMMSFRMLGLFMILPVFALYANKIPGATPTLIGVALGVYGLTQACLQMPFGALSDRIGRKPVIAIGLVLFAIGSLVAAMAHSIDALIIGRALQGSGAIGSTILATVADVTRDENRSKAMATIGLSIGLSFSLAMVLGPIINAWFHLNGIFWVTFGLALISLTLLFTTVPTPKKIIVNPATEPKANQFRKVFANTQLMRLDYGIFSLHTILTALFIAIPILLAKTLGLSEHEQVYLYLIVLALAFVAMVPFIIIAEKKRKMKPIFIGAVAVIVLAQLLLLFFHHNAITIAIVLFCFFTAFTILEASLPSLISKVSPIKRKGTAMGVYSSSQFFGIFVGGSLGGVIFSHFHLDGIFIFCGVIGLLWLIVSASMQHPPYLSTMIFELTPDKLNNIDAWQHKIIAINGVGEAAFMPEEKLLYVKADKKIITQDELRSVLNEGSL